MWAKSMIEACNFFHLLRFYITHAVKTSLNKLRISDVMGRIRDGDDFDIPVSQCTSYTLIWPNSCVLTSITIEDVTCVVLYSQPAQHGSTGQLLFGEISTSVCVCSSAVQFTA
jgi:hypothetical protein